MINSQSLNIVKDKIKFNMEAKEGQVFLTTDIYSKKTDIHQYLNPKSCYPEN